MVASSRPEKFAGDGYSQALADVLEERISRIRQFVVQDKACTRDELAKFIWGSARATRKQINPDLSENRRKAWTAAKGMLKELVDFDLFTHMQFHEPCVKSVLEKKVLDVLERYKTYVLTGEVTTKQVPPKLLGETDEILCVDKPCLYVCDYGDREGKAPKISGATSASVLLNSDKPEIQLHEYLSLKFNYETAIGTREWWKKNEDPMLCRCGQCEYCACTQAGCCNRLDKETSGVMIAAKTKKGFPEIRKQFASEHSMESGGTEKYYLALCHGNVELPAQDDWFSEDWNHKRIQNRARVQVSLVWDAKRHKSVPWESAKFPNDEHKELGDKQTAITYYEPIAWFTKKEGKDRFTLVHVQIITGRRHQIRFHMAEVGHPLLGDPTYGAPWPDREWAKRVFLHSYCTKFREPFTDRWFEAISPLPQDLGELLEKLNLTRNWEQAPKLSRRNHPSLHGCLKQYDLSTPLLHSHDPPKPKPQVIPPNGSADWSNPAAGNAVAGTDNNGGGWSWQDNGWAWNGTADNGKAGWNANNGSWESQAWGTNSANAGHAAGPPAANGGTAQVRNSGDDSDDAWGEWSGGNGDKPPEAKRPRLENTATVAGALAGLGPGPQMRAPDLRAAPGTPPDPAAPPQLPVTASWTRMESRSAKGVFYYFNQATGATQAEPPPPWEKKASRSKPDVFYYWNPLTGQTSAEKPVV